MKQHTLVNQLFFCKTETASPRASGPSLLLLLGGRSSGGFLAGGPFGGGDSELDEVGEGHGHIRGSLEGARVHDRSGKASHTLVLVGQASVGIEHPGDQPRDGFLDGGAVASPGRHLEGLFCGEEVGEAAVPDANGQALQWAGFLVVFGVVGPPDPFLEVSELWFQLDVVPGHRSLGIECDPPFSGADTEPPRAGQLSNRRQVLDVVFDQQLFADIELFNY